MQNWSTRISKCTQTNVSTDERQRITTPKYGVPIDIILAEIVF